MMRDRLHSLFSPNRIAILIVFLIMSGAVLILVNDRPNDQNSSEVVKIGVIDSGCSLGQGYVVDHRSFITTTNGYSANEISVTDVIGHGTEVCNIIHSIAPNTLIYSAKVASSTGFITYQGVIRAIDYLVNDVEVDIINLSLGGPPYLTEEFYDGLSAYQSTIFVAAAGNKGLTSDQPDGILDWPATLPQVIGVSAVGDTVNSSLTAYSSRGRAVNGHWVVEFVDSGSSNIGSGTSFATPRISAKLGKVIGAYNEAKRSYTPSGLTAILASYSSNELQFSSETGWGVPELPEKIDLNQELVLIEGSSTVDPITRLIDEKWSQSWKIVDNREFDEDDIIISGNGSHLVKEIDLNYDWWGSDLLINFHSGNESGLYSIDFRIFGIFSTYRVNIGDQEVLGVILLDHRNSINGFAHPYGEYSLMESQIRATGYVVHHSISGYINLSIFDLVMVTHFGQFIFDANLNITRQYNEIITQGYLDYLDGGGKIGFFLQPPDQFNEEYKPFLTSLNAEIGASIPPESNEIAIVSNFSDTSAIMTEVNALYFSGAEILHSGQLQDLGWYKERISDGVTTYINFRSIGVSGTHGLGEYWIFGSTSFITNTYYSEINDGTDRLIDNILISI